MEENAPDPEEKKPAKKAPASKPAQPARVDPAKARIADIVGCGVDRIVDIVDDVVTLDGEDRKLRVTGVSWSFVEGDEED